MSKIQEVIRSVIQIKIKDKETVPNENLKANLVYLVYQTNVGKMFERYTEDPVSLKILKIIYDHFITFAGEIPDHSMVERRIIAVCGYDGTPVENYLSSFVLAREAKPWINSDFKAVVRDMIHEWTMQYMYYVLNTGVKILNHGEKVGKIELRGLEDSVKYITTKLPEIQNLVKNESFIIEHNLDEIIPERVDPFWLTMPHVEMAKFHRIRRGELCVIAAATGGCKTSFLTYMASEWTKQGYNGLFFSFEMLPQEIYRLFYLTMYNNLFKNPKDPHMISDTKIDRAELTKEEKERFRTAIIEFENKYASFQVGYLTQSLTTSKICSVAKECRDKLLEKGKTLNYLMIDYPGLMAPDELKINRAGTTEYINQVIRELKISALNMGLPYIIAFQLNREYMRNAERQMDDSKKMPGLHHLSYSNEVEKSADHIFMLHTMVEQDNEKGFTMLVKKARKEPKKAYQFMFDADFKRWDSNNIIFSANMEGELLNAALSA